jgi:dethiobiotin synthetase
LNHSLLTSAAIHNVKLPFAGWAANCIDKQSAATQENIAYLRQRLQAPCLGTLPYLEKDQRPLISNAIDVTEILKY